MSQLKPFSAPAILTRISYLTDGGLSVGFATNELSDEDKLLASKYHQKFGYILFSPSQFTERDIPKPDITDEVKRPSQRLRAVLFVLWKQRGEGRDFESFYREHMEKIINRIKTQLD